ncbi:hypothetical protein Patl1_02519 [Pistacia atlantica]|uniref:Uncharacterized protein n=1 Tax=Pistacia atlantica TaxID=434234 RepID=A0ACC1C5Y0_9ROSI|nr:hypothetical protein Patl1_02519 [Pistacia atlantica]
MTIQRKIDEAYLV